MMHAGGVSAPSIAEAIMAAGADGTGSTSGVIGADDPLCAARSFIAATRVGWDRLHHPQQSEPDHNTKENHK
jgi:triosephosphate isomerase